MLMRCLPFPLTVLAANAPLHLALDAASTCAVRRRKHSRGIFQHRFV
jgi:hypothetical protein